MMMLLDHYVLDLPQMTGYVKHSKNNNDKDNDKVNDKKLLKNNNKIWEKISNLLNKEFDRKPVYGDDDKFIWAKINLYGDKTCTNFQGKKMPKENESYTFLSLIMLESVIKVQNKNCYPQTLLEECKYKIKKKKMENLINDDFDPSSSGENEESNESANEESSGFDNEKSND